MDLVTETASSDLVVRRFTVGDVPGTLWSPPSAAPGTPLVLTGHGGGLHSRHPGVVARAETLVRREGFHVASIDAPGHGGRPRSVEDEAWIAAIGRARRSGTRLDPILVELNDSLAARAVPEWRATLDALLALPGFGTDVPVGYAGMTVGGVIGVALLAVEPRIRAAVVGGFFVHPALLDTAARVTVPLEQLLPWDDPELDRDFGLRLFDAFGSPEKTLLAFPGDHRHVPGARLDTGLFARHLRSAPRPR